MTRIDPSTLPEWERELLARDDTPTPIDPADIRPGDVVERVMRMTVARRTSTDLNSTDGYAYSLEDDATWRLVHRPDPDAEAVEALAKASDEFESDAKITIANLREQGWDVVRRAES